MTDRQVHSLRPSAWAAWRPLLLLALVGSAWACAPEPPKPSRSSGSGGGSATGGNDGQGGNGGSTGTGGGGGSGAAGVNGGGGDAGVSEGGLSEGGSREAGPVASLIDDPLARPPVSLKDTGLFPEFPSTAKVHPRALEFEPRYPLYSNGLDKRRYFVMPQGKQINTAVRDDWDFPVGTLVFKTFSFKDPAAGGTDRPVETRLIRRVSDTGKLTDQWQFLVWEWNQAADAATLIDEDRFLNPIPREIIVEGEKVTHKIPDLTMCWNCHIANRSPIIGFDELRLNAKLAPAAAQTQLTQVIEKGWLTRPPTAPLAEVKGGRTPLEQTVMEYFQANCAHCHNGVATARLPGARYPELDLRYDKMIQQTVGVATMSVGTASGIRIVPRDPAKSVLLQSMKAIGDPQGLPNVKPMSTVGVERMDKKAVELVEQWIRSLPSR